MKNENTENIRTKILNLIESEYESDAAFERAIGLADKTVNNWRRGRSASFMRMLPRLCDTFRVNITELMDIPISGDTSNLSEDELHLLTVYRRARPLPTPMRTALAEVLENTIDMYLRSYTEVKRTDRRRGAKKQ